MHWRGRSTGAVWKGELGKLPGPFRGSQGKDVEYEKVQPFLVAAWRHSVVGGDRLQSQLHEWRGELWTDCERGAALRRYRLYKWTNQQQRSDDVFAIYAVS